MAECQRHLWAKGLKNNSAIQLSQTSEMRGRHRDAENDGYIKNLPCSLHVLFLTYLLHNYGIALITAPTNPAVTVCEFSDCPLRSHYLGPSVWPTARVGMAISQPGPARGLQSGGENSAATIRQILGPCNKVTV